MPSMKLKPLNKKTIFLTLSLRIHIRQPSLASLEVGSTLCVAILFLFYPAKKLLSQIGGRRPILVVGIAPSVGSPSFF